MTILNYYNFINETLKSYEIDVVDKKISTFFTQFGFNKKDGFLATTKSPYFMIHSDREYLKKRIIDYQNKKNFVTKEMMKLGYKQESLIQNAKDDLSNFSYGDIFIFTDYNTPEITEKLLHLIDTVGYFVSSVRLGDEKLTDKSKIEDTLKNLDKISIIIEPKFDKKVNYTGEYLYHTTDKKYLDKILKFGLIPKSKNTRSFYPERIYLSPDETYLLSIKDQLSKDKNGEYVDLKIRNFQGLNLYKDVRFKGGFYTYDNIHPKYIDVIK